MNQEDVEKLKELYASNLNFQIHVDQLVKIMHSGNLTAQELDGAVFLAERKYKNVD